MLVRVRGGAVFLEGGQEALEGVALQPTAESLGAALGAEVRAQLMATVLAECTSRGLQRRPGTAMLLPTPGGGSLAVAAAGDGSFDLDLTYTGNTGAPPIERRFEQLPGRSAKHRLHRLLTECEGVM